MGHPRHWRRMSLLLAFPFLSGSQPLRSLADARTHALDAALRFRRSIHSFQPPGHACLRQRAHDGTRLLQVGAWGLPFHHAQREDLLALVKYRSAPMTSCVIFPSASPREVSSFTAHGVPGGNGSLLDLANLPPCVRPGRTLAQSLELDSHRPIRSPHSQ